MRLRRVPPKLQNSTSRPDLRGDGSQRIEASLVSTLSHFYRYRWPLIYQCKCTRRSFIKSLPHYLLQPQSAILDIDPDRRPRNIHGTNPRPQNHGVCGSKGKGRAGKEQALIPFSSDRTGIRVVWGSEFGGQGFVTGTSTTTEAFCVILLAVFLALFPAACCASPTSVEAPRLIGSRCND
jgi:hypothetical protein